MRASVTRRRGELSVRAPTSCAITRRAGVTCHHSLCSRVAGSCGQHISGRRIVSNRRCVSGDELLTFNFYCFCGKKLATVAFYASLLIVVVSRNTRRRSCRNSVRTTNVRSASGLSIVLFCIFVLHTLETRPYVLGTYGVRNVWAVWFGSFMPQYIGFFQFPPPNDWWRWRFS